MVFREDILKNAKVLVEDTKKLVAAAQATQDVLATAAESSVGSVSRLADHVKLGAAALGSDDSDAQVDQYKKIYSFDWNALMSFDVTLRKATAVVVDVSAIC